MKFEEFMCFEATIPQLQAKDRDGAISELVAALVSAGSIPAELGKEVTKAVIKRENEASTGMGKGVAVPHVKHPAVKKVTAVVGHSAAGIDFASLDEQPVYSVILLISPVDNPDKHLQAMENIFRHLQKERFRKFLRQCRNAQELQDLLKEADENPSW
ncbi:MAG TPA: PTS sugar transporter subunit IIA [Sedimentisphaerales bacterium]|nr:PTS sugar transporter subunit IIA [Sedimentisphaerales bacterium]HOV77612.1 PTS sugar transporter subunit IIA [Sedimentisphaerales bacterium]HQI29156.1 PTS sugar transporter subunit IIA [Sedimentisphaerales bacterium]